MNYSRLRELPDPDHLPALDLSQVRERPAADLGLGYGDHAPRILLLYGSLRERRRKKRRACCAISAPRCASSILRTCPCRTR